MSKIHVLRWSQFLIFISFAALRSVSGLDDKPSHPSDGKKSEKGATSRSNVGLRVIIICLALVAIGLLSVLLFKLWQKKKREEQHARLLRLFEEDDELELELGLRD